MTFEALLRLVREQRVRIAELRASADRSDDDIATMRVEQSLYDGRLLELAKMLDIPVPQALPRDGGLYADHRSLIEDRLAEAGSDVRHL